MTWIAQTDTKLFRQSIVPEVPKTAGKKKCFGPFSHSCDKEYSSNCQLTSYVEHLMSDDYVFLEYQAKITNAGHAEYEGEAVHRMIKVKSVDEHGKRRPNVELEQQAGDNVLFVINPGPHKKIVIQVSCLSAKKLSKKREQRRTSIAWETARSFSIHEVTHKLVNLNDPVGPDPRALRPKWK
jgi:hypothetical protein